jgi:hypothetical protein
MEWTADVDAGDWIAKGVDDPWRSTLHDVVPRGFGAYARVLHPVTRERPVGREWPAEGDVTGWRAFQAAVPEIDVEPVRWEQVAAAFGTTMHPLAQWSRLVRADARDDGFGQPRDLDGWRYDAPQEGELDPASWATLARVLVRHTLQPHDGGVAVWEGWGGLVGGLGYGASRLFVEMDADPQHAAFLAHAARDKFNDAFRKPSWQPGILSDTISRGPRLDLPRRSFVLFRGGIAELEEPDWPARMPWQDPALTAAGFSAKAHSPAIVWPADRAWVVVSEIDFDSTIVAGRSELITELARTPGLEVQPLPFDADLSADGDTVNRTAPRR